MDAWTTNVRDALVLVLDRWERALRDCPDELWDTSLWVSTQPWPAALAFDEPDRDQLFSRFWFLAWHAVDCAHYDLEGLAMPTWPPPPPFSVARPDCVLDLAHYLPGRVITRDELLGYLSDTRRKADAVLADLTAEKVDRPVEEGHRYAGTPYVSLVLMVLTHLTEHVSQLDMHLGRHGVPRPA